MLQIRRSLVLGTLLLAACAEPPTIAPGPEASLDPDCTAPAFSIPDNLRLPPPSGGLGTVDDRWAALARQVPGGWGGFFYHEGQPTVYLVDPSQREAALRAIAPHIGRDDVLRSAVRQGRWDFAQMYDWYRYLAQHAWAVPGVHSSDIQEAQNRIIYGVRDEAAREQLTRKLTALGIPCGLVLIEITPPATIR